jgi:hypothetical protein
VKMRMKFFPKKIILKKCMYFAFCSTKYQKNLYTTLCNVVKNSEKTNGCTMLL